MKDQNMTDPKILEAERWGGGVDPRGEKQPELPLKEIIIEALYTAKISHSADRYDDGQMIMEFRLAGDDENVIEVKIVGL